MNNRDAIRLFFLQELKELRGRRNLNMWILAGIFFISVAIIGFGTASINYLKHKMDDPFINWVDVNLGQTVFENDKMAPDIYLKDTAVQRRYRFGDPQPNYVHYRSFRNADDTKSMQFDGRSIEAWPNPILEKILDDDNVIVKRKNMPLGKNDIGIIVTKSMINALGYNSEPNFIALWQSQDTSYCIENGYGHGKDGGFYPFYIPVIAVVKQLPGMNDWLFTDRYWHEARSNDAFDINHPEKNNCLILCGNDSYLSKLENAVKFENGISVSLEDYKESWQHLRQLRISGLDGQNQVREYNDIICNKLKPDFSQCTRVYEFETNMTSEAGAPQFYSIQMENLDSIRAFAEALRENCGIQLEMTNIEDKENFNFVQRMGVTLSLCIIFIVAAFITVFIYFMLRSHFLKIQHNLGTFKAFGVDNMTLMGIYSMIMLTIVAGTFFAGGLAALILSLVWRIWGCIEPGFPWIDVLVGWNGLLFLLALVAAVLGTLIVCRSTLKKTPGDLIYDR